LWNFHPFCNFVQTSELDIHFVVKQENMDDDDSARMITTPGEADVDMDSDTVDFERHVPLQDLSVISTSDARSEKLSDPNATPDVSQETISQDHGHAAHDSNTTEELSSSMPSETDTPAIASSNVARYQALLTKESSNVEHLTTKQKKGLQNRKRKQEENERRKEEGHLRQIKRQKGEADFLSSIPEDRLGNRFEALLRCWRCKFNRCWFAGRSDQRPAGKQEEFWNNVDRVYRVFHEDQFMILWVIVSHEMIAVDTFHLTQICEECLLGDNRIHVANKKSGNRNPSNNAVKDRVDWQIKQGAFEICPKSLRPDDRLFSQTVSQYFIVLLFDEDSGEPELSFYTRKSDGTWSKQPTKEKIEDPFQLRNLRILLANFKQSWDEIQLNLYLDKLRQWVSTGGQHEPDDIEAFLQKVHQVDFSNIPEGILESERAKTNQCTMLRLASVYCRSNLFHLRDTDHLNTLFPAGGTEAGKLYKVENGVQALPPTWYSLSRVGTSFLKFIADFDHEEAEEFESSDSFPHSEWGSCPSVNLLLPCFKILDGNANDRNLLRDISCLGARNLWEGAFLVETVDVVKFLRLTFLSVKDSAGSAALEAWWKFYMDSEKKRSTTRRSYFAQLPGQMVITASPPDLTAGSTSLQVHKVRSFSNPGSSGYSLSVALNLLQLVNLEKGFAKCAEILNSWEKLCGDPISRQQFIAMCSTNNPLQLRAMCFSEKIPADSSVQNTFKKLEEDTFTLSKNATRQEYKVLKLLWSDLVETNKAVGWELQLCLGTGQGKKQHASYVDLCKCCNIGLFDKKFLLLEDKYFFCWRCSLDLFASQNRTNEVSRKWLKLTTKDVPHSREKAPSSSSTPANVVHGGSSSSSSTPANVVHGGSSGTSQPSTAPRNNSSALDRRESSVQSTSIPKTTKKLQTPKKASTQN
jgi:hypothetical protein